MTDTHAARIDEGNGTIAPGGRFHPGDGQGKAQARQTTRPGRSGEHDEFLEAIGTDPVVEVDPREHLGVVHLAGRGVGGHGHVGAGEVAEVAGGQHRPGRRLRRV